MAIPLALIPLGIQAGKAIYTAFNKPKLREPKELIRTLDRQIANREADIVNKTLMNQITSGAKSLGARMYQQQERGLDVMRARGDLSEGQHAQALMDLGTQVQTAVGEQTENAMLQQAQVNLQQQERIDTARLKIAELKDMARQQYQAETQQWRNELAGSIADTVITGFNTAMTSIENKNVQSAVDGYLKGKGVDDITKLDDAGLQGLTVTLLMAKMGLTPLAQSGETPPENITGLVGMSGKEWDTKRSEELMTLANTPMPSQATLPALPVGEGNVVPPQDRPLTTEPVDIQRQAAEAASIDAERAAEQRKKEEQALAAFRQTFDPTTTVIEVGKERILTMRQVQDRINYLLKTKDWSDPELNRLVEYRDGNKETPPPATQKPPTATPPAAQKPPTATPPAAQKPPTATPPAAQKPPTAIMNDVPVVTKQEREQLHALTRGAVDKPFANSVRNFLHGRAGYGSQVTQIEGGFYSVTLHNWFASELTEKDIQVFVNDLHRKSGRGGTAPRVVAREEGDRIYIALVPAK